MPSNFLFACAFLTFITSAARAEVVDPQTYIAEHGFQKKRLGDDGKMVFYEVTNRTTASAVKQFERDVAALPKDPRVFQVCDFMRGGIKASLIESSGKAIDVSVSNYGYAGSTIACVLKYMSGDKVGTQVIFYKKAGGSMYNYTVTH